MTQIQSDKIVGSIHALPQVALEESMNLLSHVYAYADREEKPEIQALLNLEMDEVFRRRMLTLKKK